MTIMPATTVAPASSADTPAGPHAVLVRGLTHRYRRPARRGAVDDTSTAADQPALNQLDLSVQAGCVFGILGPNGGGKTTLFRILATLLRPSEGTIRVFGSDPLTHPDLVRQHLGVVFQMPSLDIKLTARENLLHQGHLYGLSGATLRERLAASLDAVNLADRADDRVETFSGGMRRRVEIAKAMLHRPRLLLLDEPTNGLDPVARRDVWAQLATLRQTHGMTIVLTTHLMDEADRCDELAILSEGRLVAGGTPDALKAAVGGDVVTLDPEPIDDDREEQSPPVAAERMREQVERQWGPWPDDHRPQVIDGRVRFEHPDGAALIARLTEAMPGRIRSITVGRPTLEDVFMLKTGRSL